VVFGSALLLTGVSRELPRPRLASSPDLGGSWTEVGRLGKAASGAVSLEVAPTRTTRYRIQVEGAASPEIVVEVAPRVRLRQPPEPRALAGTVRPALRGAPVSIERRRGTEWAPVARSTVDAAGNFRVELALQPGSYRARVGKTGSWAEGVSPGLEVNG
jgi:hypothetical protein